MALRCGRSVFCAIEAVLRAEAPQDVGQPVIWISRLFSSLNELQPFEGGLCVSSTSSSLSLPPPQQITPFFSGVVGRETPAFAALTEGFLLHSIWRRTFLFCATGEAGWTGKDLPLVHSLPLCFDTFVQRFSLVFAPGPAFYNAASSAGILCLGFLGKL